MWLFDKSLEAINEADLQQLVEGGFGAGEEGRLIDFKQDLPGGSEKDQFELRADIVSFANASGGLLIYGMQEEGGKATSVLGLEIANTEKEILRLESVAQSGVQPRIAITTRAVPLSTGRVVIIIRIPRSWTGPHAVVRDRWLTFAVRGSKGKQYLDVGQVRAAIIGTESAIERVRAFRADRVARLIAGEAPVVLVKRPLLILHVVPLNAFAPGLSYDVAALASQPDIVADLMPMGTRSYENRRPNFDGLLTYGTDRDKVDTYQQIFRNGAIEAVDTESLYHPAYPAMIPTILFEQSLIEALPHMLALQRWLRVEPPVVVMVTLAGVKDHSLAVRDPLFGLAAQREPERIDRDVLMVPEILIESMIVEADQALRPAIDAVWNAGGYARSPNYKDDKWVGAQNR